MKLGIGAAVSAVVIAMISFPGLKAQSIEDTTLSKVEVVFVLDSTGSMGGLIEGAKQKIWSIANRIVELELAREGRIGLISYRDRGDQYVTRFYDLTDDLDSAFSTLQSFRAAGGGDSPESVNQALNEAVHRTSWTAGQDVLRIVFLVGDAPPHMDYRDDVTYQESCRDAVRAGVIINTVQCGGSAATRMVWNEIADLGKGAYVALAQSGNMVVISTPYDKEILRLTAELNRTVVAYGTTQQRKTTAGKLAAAENASAAVAADRAAFNLSTGGKVIQGIGDLVADRKSGLVDLASIDPSSLPAEARSMTSVQLEHYLSQMQAKRDSLNFQLADLNGDRAAYLAQEKLRRAASESQDAFDAKVTEILAEEAARMK